MYFGAFENPWLRATWRGVVSEGVDEVARSYVEVKRHGSGEVRGNGTSVVGAVDIDAAGSAGTRAVRLERGQSVSKRSGHLAKFSRKGTAEQWGKVKGKTRCVSWRIFNALPSRATATCERLWDTDNGTATIRGDFRIRKTLVYPTKGLRVRSGDSRVQK